MFGFGKGSSAKTPVDKNGDGLLSRLRQGLTRTRTSLGNQLIQAISDKPTFDEELLDTLESCLLQADVGIEVTTDVMDELRLRYPKGQATDSTALQAFLQQYLLNILSVAQQTSHRTEQSPTVILFVGVNGAGKTTTIGKLAKQIQQAGSSVLLAAGDTYRAAAVEQLQVWGERNQIPVVAQQTGADSASVIYDAITSAKARQLDVVLADTAGRLHTQNNLMAEIQKIKRVCQKIHPDYPHEIWLILDASIGQNAISQVEQFHEALHLTGLVMTKLDGTAKGGVLFALAKRFSLPIRYIGVGEGIDDLRPFDAESFVRAIFATSDVNDD